MFHIEMQIVIKKLLELSCFNVVVDWLTLQLRIRDVPVSNINPGILYREAFRGSLQSLQKNAGLVPSN
jgi:hypothetical protein